MDNKKRTGSFYTPEYLSGFIMRYIAPKFEGLNNLSVFEPSVGDGSFVRAFNNTQFPNSIRNFSFTAIDKILPELRKAESESQINRRTATKYSFSKADFLKYQKNLDKRFSLIIGNPPYIKKSLLSKAQIALCQDIHNNANLGSNTVKNIWPAFLVRCSQLLNDNGVLSLILPAELLQVKFASELRGFLTTYFQRIEIFTFDDLLFECKGQDTVLLIAYKQSLNPGQFYTHIANPNQLVENTFTLIENATLTPSDTKWTHHFLSDDELNFIHNIGSRLEKINYYCDSKPGIVTAGNRFFIINEETERRYHLERYTRPIIQKALFVNGSITFDTRDFDSLVAQGKPTKVLCFEDRDAGDLPIRVQNYLKLGEDLGLPYNYKCSRRENWFVIPNISAVPEGFFFRRTHFYPKLLKNIAEVLVTDTAYKIEMKQGYNINQLIYSFYNSLTLTFAELNGRYYGGGVLELTPSEFKNLPIPNTSITARDFDIYIGNFENKTGINDVLNANDFHILNGSLNLSAEEISRIRVIYKKLINKRFRKKE